MVGYPFPEWVTIDGYPNDDRYPPEHKIVLVDVEGEGIFPGWFDFRVWRWEWVRIEIAGLFSNDEPEMKIRVERQRETYDPYIKRWMHFPSRKGEQ